MKNENGRTQGLLIWSFFTAIMIIVVSAAVLKFVFGVDFSGKTINETAKMKENNIILTPPTMPPSVKTEGIEVVPTMEDEIEGDSVYVPTFQLVWNDLMDEVVKGPVKFIDEEEPEYLNNLNKQLFKENDISEEYIYKKYGVTSNKLKEEILQGIKDKFGESSDIIDENEDWGENEEKGAYTFYSMLKRVFNFTNPFDVLENGAFGDDYENVEYFGINSESDSKLYDQVHILFYDDEEKFAFLVDTKEGDELIFAKGIDGKNFNEIYNAIEDKTEKYEGKSDFTSIDKLRIPNLNLNSTKEYVEVCKKPFEIAEGSTLIISRAFQTIKLELDNEGGKIKSEAIIQTKSLAAFPDENEEKPRLLFLNDSFTMFVRETGKDKPYFALNVNDISKYQENVN